VSFVCEGAASTPLSRGGVLRNRNGVVGDWRSTVANYREQLGLPSGR